MFVLSHYHYETLLGSAGPGITGEDEGGMDGGTSTGDDKELRCDSTQV